MIFIEHDPKLNEVESIVFIDRDGVINRNRPDYVKSLSDIEIIDLSEKAMEVFKNKKTGLIIITNQQVIGKKIISLEFAISIHLEIISQVTKTANPIVASLICPHLQTSKCECRKPGIKMIQYAQKIYEIDQTTNYFAGDFETDIQTAINANLKSVKIGDEQSTLEADHEFNTLHDFAQFY